MMKRLLFLGFLAAVMVIGAARHGMAIWSDGEPLPQCPPDSCPQ